jgi:hypothetical protein
MDERIKRLTNPKDARTFAKNARERGHLDLEAQALEHARTLQGVEAGYTTPAELAIASALYAYEEEQTRLKGRTFRANRTRQMLTNRGALGAAERMVLTRQPSKGYEVLEEAGLQELSFEAIIVRFPDEFSEQAVQAARARLDGAPFLPPHQEPTPTLDADARNFLRGFDDPTTWYRTNWLPRYRATTEAIAQDLAQDDLDEPFEIIWRRADNNVAGAGQGLLSFDTVDALRPLLMQVLRDIWEDGQPDRYEHVVARFEAWKVQGRINKVPRMLIARAFAALHPDRYHTTVDAASQDRILPWFAEHTGFLIPRSPSWAVRSEALTTHLDRLGVFGDDIHARNIFPWFVLDQLRTAGRAPGHTPRPDSAFADLPASQRTIELRHNRIQSVLFAQLEAEYGAGAVWTEYPTGTGGFADAFVRRSDGRCIVYEIKVADTASQIVRQAMGQLLEYSYRAGGLEPVQLVAVGEPALDATTQAFLERLRTDFRLAIEYIPITLPEEP